jgi:HEAT repeat protein
MAILVTATGRRVAAILTILLTSLGGAASGQPTVPREQATAATSGGLRALVDRLYSPDPKARAEAACEIGRRGAGAAAAIPVLLSLLSDDVTVPALECEMSPWLRRTLITSPDAVKWAATSPAKEAAEALGDIGNASVPGLVQALSHSDWKTRKFAAVGLGEVDQIVQPAPVIAALASHLTDGHIEVRDQSAWALGEIEDRGAVEPLLNALHDPEARVRARAAWALGEIEDAAAVSGLVATLNDPDAAVREKSVWALGEIESATAVEGLLPLLSDPDAKVRRQAAWALGEIESPSAVTALAAVLKDADWQVRRTAAWALGEIEDPRAFDDLRAAASDSNAEVRRAVSQALRELRDRRR